ncbi:unnamed protein product [Leptidea sinapis]|uniref:Uncharacterized protein n=1 Tax=Leptidea sinapis TaxID=189913 RepID=A0A5E4PVY9_9NEOP|nr:unnamed protein product [Leptidea sinapis]
MRPDSHVSGDPENFPMARNRSGKKLKVNQCHYTRPTTTTGHLNTTYEFSAYFAWYQNVVNTRSAAAWTSQHFV